MWSADATVAHTRSKLMVEEGFTGMYPKLFLYSHPMDGMC